MIWRDKYKKILKKNLKKNSTSDFLCAFKELLNTLLNDKNSFDTSNKTIIKIIKSQGYSLSIVLKEIILELLSGKLTDNMPQIISDLSDLENQVTKSTFGDIYITSLVGIFKKNDKCS
mgnify:CR=1 FL=1